MCGVGGKFPMLISINTKFKIKQFLNQKVKKKKKKVLVFF